MSNEWAGEWLEEVLGPFWTPEKHSRVYRELDEDELEWIKSKPKIVQLMMMDHPPFCLAKRILPCWECNSCIGVGELAVVFGYHENTQLFTTRPMVREGVFIPRHHLKVVACWNGITKEKIIEIFGDPSKR